MKLHLLTPSIPKNPDSATRTALMFLQASAKAKGHTLEFISSNECKMRFSAKPEILVNNKKIKINALIVRPSFSWKNADIHANLIKQFELSGVPTLNSYNSIMMTKNKIRTLQILSKYNIPMPKTYVIRSAEFIPEIMKDIGSYPVILKAATGAKGIGVSIVESQRGLRSMVEMLMSDDEEAHPLVVQEYIKEARGTDVRVFIVGDKIIAAMDRIATKKGEFRSNFSLGGKVKVASLSPEEKKVSLKAAKACGLDFAGVDLIRSKRGPKVLEVNSNPGLQGITEATGIDVAGYIIDLAVKRAHEKKKR
jgi:ribosomal protein S6--L-glutamate ligase